MLVEVAEGTVTLNTEISNMLLLQKRLLKTSTQAVSSWWDHWGKRGLGRCMVNISIDTRYKQRNNHRKVKKKIINNL